MKTDVIKDVAYYEALPYTVTIRKDDEGDFVARIAELPGSIAHGETESAAIENVRSVQRLWIEEALIAGNPIPEPEEAEMPSGKWVQRVPRRLHKQLATAAQEDNVSLNQLVTSMLSEALAVRNCTHAFEAVLGRMPQATYQLRDPFTAMWWPGHPIEQGQGWAIHAHPQSGTISETLARVRKIRSSDKVEVAEEQLRKHIKEQLVGR